MTKENLKSPPANITEFTAITGLVFTQLYEQFPVAVDLDRAAIESAMGTASSSSHVLQSGRPFTEVFVHSLTGLLPYEKVTLTTKGLAALNAIPQGLSTTIGSTIAANTSAGNWSAVGDLIGGVIAGFTKSIAGS